jgi:hypothetical protein
MFSEADRTTCAVWCLLTMHGMVECVVDLWVINKSRSGYKGSVLIHMAIVLS